MRNISTSLSSHLASSLTTLATCFKITLSNGQQMGFTSCDTDLHIGGLVYQADAGCTPSAIVSQQNLAADNLEIKGMISSDLITEEDLLSGKYDQAEILVFLVNYQDLSAGELILHRGWLAEITLQGAAFCAEIRGISDKTNNCITKLYSEGCRASFGDNCCSLDLAKYQHKAVIAEIISDRQLRLSESPIGFFNYGQLKYTNGVLAIKHCHQTQVTLLQSQTHLLHLGEQVLLTAGCDKKFTTCCEIYHNAINFRGETHLPGMNQLNKTVRSYE